MKALTAGEEVPLLPESLQKKAWDDKQGLYPVQCIYGGVPKRDQRQAWGPGRVFGRARVSQRQRLLLSQAISQTGIDMAICTPGRLQVHLPLPAVYFSNPLSGCFRKDLVEEETVDLSSVSQAQGRVASASRASRRGRDGFPPARVRSRLVSFSEAVPRAGRGACPPVHVRHRGARLLNP